MIIGVCSDEEQSIHVSSYLKNKYKFEIINVDEILNQILINNEIKFETLNNPTKRIVFWNCISKINGIIQNIINSNSSNLVINCSFLEILQIFHYLDIKIKVDSNKNKNYFNSYVELLKSDANYHLNLNLEQNWQEKLDNFMLFDVNGDKKVSIIIPVYNTSKYLIKCVKSVMNQNYHNIEIILINDGSTDNSIDICNMLANEDKRIRVISQSNIGLSETRNRGIREATGDYICLIDSDDFMENDMIETLLENALKTNADVSSVRAYVHTRDGKINKYSDVRIINIYTGKDEAITAYANGNISIAMWDKLFKKDFINKMLFDKMVYQEDADFMLKLCSNGGVYVCDTKECYHYIKRNSDSITSKINYRIFQMREWALNFYNKLIQEFGETHLEDAEKILFNSLSHILKMYLRDLKKGKVNVGEYQEELQLTANDLMYLLLHTNNIDKFKDLDNVLEVVNELIDKNAIDKSKMPSFDLECIGILWNALNEDLIREAIMEISHESVIQNYLITDLGDAYRDFIDDIYYFENEFEGIPYLKGCGLIDMYDSNKIAIIYLKIKITNIIKDKMKGYMFKEVADLKHRIRKAFKTRIRNYAYDNIFHLTVNEREFNYTDNIVRKYIARDEEQNYGRK